MIAFGSNVTPAILFQKLDQFANLKGTLSKYKETVRNAAFAFETSLLYTEHVSESASGPKACKLLSLSPP